MEMAGISAVLQFDGGMKALHSVMTLAKIPPNMHAQKAGEIKDKTRLSDSARKASELQKKKRVAQRQAKLVREQEAREREGGPSYASGAFNEEATLGLQNSCISPKFSRRIVGIFIQIIDSRAFNRHCVEIIIHLYIPLFL